MKMLNPNAAEWNPTAFSTAAVMGTKGQTSFISCAASSKSTAAAAGKLTIQASANMHVDADTGLATPNGLAELATVLSGAASADMNFDDLMFDNSSRRGSVSLLLVVIVFLLCFVCLIACGCHKARPAATISRRWQLNCIRLAPGAADCGGSNQRNIYDFI
jgi:predicted anti-sigma-YlaC factor YlaD